MRNNWLSYFQCPVQRSSKHRKILEGMGVLLHITTPESSVRSMAVGERDQAGNMIQLHACGLDGMCHIMNDPFQ